MDQTDRSILLRKYGNQASEGVREFHHGVIRVFRIKESFRHMLYTLACLNIRRIKKQWPLFYLSLTEALSVIEYCTKVFRLYTEPAFIGINVFVCGLIYLVIDHDTFCKRARLIDHHHGGERPLRCMPRELSFKPLFKLLEAKKAGLCTCVSAD